MANYQKGQKIGFASGGAPGTTASETFFYGASEAPRVHGLTGSSYTSIPRFKNQYFVAFKYSNLASTQIGIDPEDLKGITHRVKTIDAPRFDIETETLNQYNKPRILPVKLTYQPITITFWDDKSNEVTNFWRQIYEFYFHNGRRPGGEASYGIRDSNTITDPALGNSASQPAYNNYGYYMGNKHTNMNLFSYMSLYLVANRVCHRIDLVNPYLQSMQHDQFSQEMSGELAQNTVTWGYENVVYYGRKDIKDEQALMGVIGGNPSNIFHWDETEDEYKRGFSGLYARTATGESTQPTGKNPPGVNYPAEALTGLGIGKIPTSGPSSATKAPIGNEVGFYERYGGGEGGYKPVSGITSSESALKKHLGLSEQYAAIAAKETSYTRPEDFPAISTYMDKKIKEEQAAARAALDGGLGFGAVFNSSQVGGDESASKLDKIKAKSDTSSPAAGSNNRPTTDKQLPMTSGNSASDALVASKSQQIGAPQSPASSGHSDDPSGAR